MGFCERTMNTPTSTSTTPAICAATGCSPNNSQPANKATLGVRLLNTDACAMPIVFNACATIREIESPDQNGTQQQHIDGVIFAVRHVPTLTWPVWQEVLCGRFMHV